MIKEDRIFIATYNSYKSPAIYSASFNFETGNLEILNSFQGVDIPSYITLSKKRECLYSVSELQKDGVISSFAIKEDGKLEFINSLPVSGSYPCHVTINDEESLAVVSNYMDGVVDIFSINEDGSLKEKIYTNKHVGKGPNQERQECAHAHFSMFFPNNNKEFLTCDLGCDSIFHYSIDNDNIRIVDEIKVPAGSGPRHLIFNKNDSSILYCVCELKMCVYVIKLNSKGSDIIQCIDAIEKNRKMDAGCAAIRIDDKNQYLFTSCRVYDEGKDCLASYKINEDGTLSDETYHYIDGKNSRDINICNDYLIDCCQTSNKVQIYKINKNNHIELNKVSEIEIPQPSCVTYVK